MTANKLTSDRLTSIDTLEEELTALQADLRGSLALLAQLNHIPEQFANLAAETAAINAASATATAAAEEQAHELAAARVALEERFAHWLQEAGAREAQLAAGHAALEDRFTQWLQETGARETQLAEQWNAFRTAAETEQNQVMRIAMTTRQELIDRAGAQEQLVSALNERMEKMNTSLTNMVEDLQDARREQKRLAILVTFVSLLALGLSAAASYVVFF